jgi:transcriptional regulator of arginine metabolism
MPNAACLPTDRREAIRRILLSGPADNQQWLVDSLIAQGFVATQSSVSRDLREIGAIKTSRGYELADESRDASDEIAKVAALLRDIKPAGPNVLVIKTAIGAAQRVALALDRCDWPEIVGNVGGDDTVFTATVDGIGQRNLISKIERAARRR